MEYVLVKYLHILAILVLVSTLVVEHVLLKPIMSYQDVKKIARIDGVYGLSAVVVLITGLTLWLAVGKHSQFYTLNPVFHAKLAMFVLIALISLYPTLFFLRARHHYQHEVAIPQKVSWCIRAELLLLVFMPLLAVLMAQGYGLS